jgi:3-methyladenine DNA glycosylase AlkD
MARFGIAGGVIYGISVAQLRNLARRIRRDHGLARRLWASGVHEARILASMVDDPALVTGEQMERWVRDFDSWDLCDQVCGNLFDKTPFAYQKALAWSRRRGEFVRRAGFALMAWLAVHDKGAPDARFRRFLPPIVRASTDGRTYVRKAVNWALRQIGKRNARLRHEAVRTAQRIRRIDAPAARWIAGDALRELMSPAVRRRTGR